jgi:hypothetical protein
VAERKDRSANGTSPSVGLAGLIMRSNSRDRSGWSRGLVPAAVLMLLGGLAGAGCAMMAARAGDAGSRTPP